MKNKLLLALLVLLCVSLGLVGCTKGGTVVNEEVGSLEEVENLDEDEKHGDSNNFEDDRPDVSTDPVTNIVYDPNQEPIEIEDESTKEARKAEIVDKMNNQVKDGALTMTMTTQLRVEQGASEGAIKIMNRNKNPLLVEIYLKDSETLVSSEVVEVGETVDKVNLLFDLEAGEYKGTSYMSLLDPDTREKLGTGGVGIDIIVLP